MAARKLLSEEQLLILMEEVKKRPWLWNTEHESYNDRSLIAIAWSEIASAMDLPENIIRVKWKNLRDLFMREVKKINITDVDDYMGRWKYFKTLWFLHQPDSSGLESNADSNDTSEPMEAPESFVKAELREDSDSDIAETQDSEAQAKSSPRPKKRKTETLTDEDCDLMFLKSLAPYFKDLKPLRKLMIRNKIQEMLLNEIAKQSGSNGNL